MQSGEKHRQHENQRGYRKNYTPVHCVSQNSIFLQNVKCVGATVIEFRFFNRITKKKKKKKKNTQNL